MNRREKDAIRAYQQLPTDEQEIILSIVEAYSLCNTYKRPGGGVPDEGQPVTM